MASVGLYPRLKPQWSWRELAAAFIPRKKAVSTYEKAFATKFGCEHGVMFSHGRSGMYALFKAWGLDKAEIICPAYTCVVVQHAIVLSGNIPVFVDSAKDSFNMSDEGIEESFTENTRAIVVTHLFGYPMDVNRVEQLVRKAEEKYGHKIYILQDAAHSYGAKWEGELVTSKGDAAIFGSNISKMITSIFGGMITTNNPETYEKLTSYRKNHFVSNRMKWISRLVYMMATYVAFNKYVYGIVNWMERKGLLDRFVKYYDEGKIDFPADWDQLPIALEARVGMVQLKRYDAIIAARRANALKVIEAFKEDSSIQFREDYLGNTYSHCVAMVENRAEWEERFRAKGYQLGILIEYSVPEMEAYQKYKNGKTFPNSAYYSEHLINFPIWKGVSIKF